MNDYLPLHLEFHKIAIETKLDKFNCIKNYKIYFSYNQKTNKLKYIKINIFLNEGEYLIDKLINGKDIQRTIKNIFNDNYLDKKEQLIIKMIHTK